MDWVSILGWTVVACVLGWPAVWRYEAWPFSSFPMFSERVPPAAVRVRRIALEWSDGTRTWWTPPWHRMPQRLLRRCAGATPGIPELEDARIIWRAVERTDDTRELAALCIVERSVHGGVPPWAIEDRTLARYPRNVLANA